MISRKQYQCACERTLKYFDEAGIIITGRERHAIEVADFGLGLLEDIGLQILTYINTERVCAKELVLFPRQTCPEHRHVSGEGYEGKEETFRCRKGMVYLYVEGNDNENKRIQLPPTDVTVFNEVILREGEQYTLAPNTLHWFRAGDKGAIVSEFSTKSTDETDIFTDKRITRIPKVAD